MTTSLVLTPLSHLLSHRPEQAWDSYWASCTPSASPDSSFVSLIATLIHHIEKSQARRVFLVCEDRFLFLAGFLATLHTRAMLVLPPADTPGLLTDLMTGGDVLLSDQESLSRQGYPFISLCPQEIVTELPFFSSLDPSLSCVSFYTSGSTGHPKSIVKSLEQLETEIQALEKMWGHNKEGNLLSTVSHHHIYGLLFSLLWPVCRNSPLHRRTYSYWEEVFPYITPTSFLISSPAHLERFPLGCPPLRCAQVFSSGGPLSYDAAQKTAEIFSHFPHEVYGSTETGGIAHRQQQDLQTPWTPFPGMRIWTNDQLQLCLFSPYLPTAYETQDQIDLLPDGTFFLKGRLDRIAKIEGKRVSLTQIERLLCQNNLIKEAWVVVFPKSGTCHRDTVAAVIVLTSAGQDQLRKTGKLPLINMFNTHLKHTIDPVVCPRKWRFMEQLPTNAQGKRPLALLHDLFTSSQESSVSSSSPVTMPILLDIKTQENQCCVTLSIPKDLFYLEGHFPHLPLVPGVVQLHWAVEYAKAWTNSMDDFLSLSPSSSDVKQIKFQQILRPEDTVCLVLTNAPEKKTVAYQYQSPHGHKVYSSGKLSYEILGIAYKGSLS